MREAGFGGGLDRGESVDLALLPDEPVLDGEDHREVLLGVGQRGLGVGRGQGGLFGVLEVVGSVAQGLGLLLLLAVFTQETPSDAVACGFAVLVVSSGLFGSCFYQAVSFDIESGHVVAARANHHQGCSHRRSPVWLSPVRWLSPIVGCFAGRHPNILGLTTALRPVPTPYRRSVKGVCNTYRQACSVHVNRTMPKRQELIPAINRLAFIGALGLFGCWPVNALGLIGRGVLDVVGRQFPRD